MKVRWKERENEYKDRDMMTDGKMDQESVSGRLGMSERARS